MKSERRYRVFVDLERDVERFPFAKRYRADGSIEEVVIWCSNDYLCMGSHPEVIAAMQAAAAQHGAGKAAQIIRKVLLRQTAIINYINPF